MCEVMKKYEQIAAEKARAQGRMQERKATIRKMLKRGDTPEEIADFYEIDVAEVEMVEKEMCTLA